MLRSAKRAPANIRRLNNISDVIFYCSVGERSRALALLNAALALLPLVREPGDQAIGKTSRFFFVLAVSFKQKSIWFLLFLFSFKFTPLVSGERCVKCVRVWTYRLYIVEIHYFFKILLLFSQAQIIQTEGIVMMTKEGYTKVVNFMTPGARRWPYKSHNENAFFFSPPRHRSDKLRV